MVYIFCALVVGMALGVGIQCLVDRGNYEDL